MITLALCVVLGGSVYAFGNPYERQPAVAAAATDWGLSFQTEGAAPIGNATEIGRASCRERVYVLV